MTTAHANLIAMHEVAREEEPANSPHLPAMP